MAKEVSPHSTWLYHANMPWMLKHPHTCATPLIHLASSYRHDTGWHCGTPVTRSVRTHCSPHCATPVKAHIHPSSCTDMCYATSIMHKSILHTQTVTSNLSLLACPQGPILLFHYPLLGRDKKEFFNISLHSRLWPLTAVFSEHISNTTELWHIWEIY